MDASRGKRVQGNVSGMRGWAVFQLPSWLVVFLVTVVTVYVIALGASIGSASLTAHEWLLLGAVLACFAATVELTKREGENAGLIIDVYGVWELPIAVLLPPLYALAVPAFRLALNQWRVKRVPLHRRVFSAAVTGLSYGSASLAFHAFTGSGTGTAAFPDTHRTQWILAVAGVALLRWVVNESLLMPAIKGSDPVVSVRRLLLSRETLQNDAAELCVAVLVTSSIAISLLTLVFALPFVTLLQRSIRHAQLVDASRLDTKTGLLNAGTWEREAAAEVSRAVRTRSPLAVAIIDVDHFKAVNDAYGHLAGDKALQALARTLREFLREYDLVGRFGGEEFVLLLPQTKAVDAYRIAERIRAHVRSMTIEVGSDNGAEQVRLTVSIGVAALGSRWDTSTGGQLTDLLAAADGALYRAKQDGRDQVCVITENATFSVLAHAPSFTRAKPANVTQLPVATPAAAAAQQPPSPGNTSSPAETSVRSSNDAPAAGS
jgi:diguanylate cyclase (GGDEF)-like protein